MNDETLNEKLTKMRTPTGQLDERSIREMDDHTAGWRAYQDGAKRDKSKSAAWLKGFDQAAEFTPETRANRT